MFFKTTQTKIFCLSMQRTGTTSVGQFFKDNNFKVADWGISHANKWSYYWDQGDFETIFNSKYFNKNQVFEDDPWWLPEFYKVLYHRFPKSKFVLFTRNPSDWFNSMNSHSKGKVLGNTKLHCKVYRRESDFYNLIKKEDLKTYNELDIDNLLELDGYDNHYKDIYINRNREIVDFFIKHAPNSLFTCELEDSLKWNKLADFVGINLDNNYQVHANKSNL